MLPPTLASATALAISLALPVPGSDTPPQAARWVAPLDPAVVVAGFAPPPRRWLPGHRGVDLAAGLGQEVRAAGAGRVAFAGPLAGRGVVVVVHADGLRTTYEPVDAVVAEGEEVAVDEVVGTVGDGDVHCGREPRCLHWGLRRGRDYLDPWLLIDPGRAVLLPP